MPFPLGGGPGFAHDGAGWERPRPVSLPGHSLASARLPGHAAMGSPWLCALGTPGGQTVPPGVGAPPGAEVVKVAGPQLRAPARGGLLPWAGPVAVTAEAARTRARGRALRSACVVAAGVPRGPSGDRAGSLGTPCDLTGPRARPVRAQWHLLQASVSCCPSWSGHLRTSWAWELMCLDAVGDPQQPPSARPSRDPGRRARAASSVLCGPRHLLRLPLRVSARGRRLRPRLLVHQVSRQRRRTRTSTPSLGFPFQ